jgi:hypothetical protein
MPKIIALFVEYKLFCRRVLAGCDCRVDWILLDKLNNFCARANILRYHLISISPLFVLIKVRTKEVRRANHILDPLVKDIN